MRRLRIMVLLAVCFSVVAFIQTTNGQINLTLLSAQTHPVAGVTVRFLSEQGEVISTCTTDGSGACTVKLEAAPADASGFIRGTLVVAGYGDRPLIWPGGPLDITLQLNDAGNLDVPLDVLATRGPTTDVIVQPLTEADLAATATVLAMGATTVTPLPQAAATGAALAVTPVPSVRTSAPDGAGPVETPAEPNTSSSPWWPIVTLVAVLVGGATLSLFLSLRKGRTS